MKWLKASLTVDQAAKKATCLRRGINGRGGSFRREIGSTIHPIEPTYDRNETHSHCTSGRRRQQHMDWSHPFSTTYEPAQVISPGAGAAVVGAGGDGEAGGDVGALVEEATFKLKLYVSWHEASALSHSMTR